MATEKSIKIQKNKILTYSVNKSGFKSVYGSILVSENQDININLKNLEDVTEPFQLGDRLFGISSFVDYFTPSGTYDVDSLKYISASQTTGSGLTNIAVVKDTWLSQVEQTLSVETPRGSSNTFVFTYDGSNWQLSGATTQSNVDLEDYGISFTGTATSGDVITVVETQYNKFAFFVLDANYRGTVYWSNITNATIMPKQYTSAPTNCLESANYYNQVVFDNANLSEYPIFNNFKNIGTFILPNQIKINALVPNSNELQLIYNNRAILDTFDPITIADPSASRNLTNWNFSGDLVWCCIEDNASLAWSLSKTNSWVASNYGNNKKNYRGSVPIFEVPVM